MTARFPVAAVLLTVLGACAAAPIAPIGFAPVDQAVVERPAPPLILPEPAVLIESPPLEPAPPISAALPVEPVRQPALRTAQVTVTPPPEPSVPATLSPPQVIIAEPTAEEREFAALLADLQRYNTMAPDDVRRESQVIAQAISRGRSDANRVRLAVLHTLGRQNPQDDQRALQLFDAVAKSNPASPSIKQLAAVLSYQVAERVRAVRDEQARSEAALQKLEALRAMERSLLRDRVRSGGGGGGAGSGGGN